MVAMAEEGSAVLRDDQEELHTKNCRVIEYELLQELLLLSAIPMRDVGVLGILGSRILRACRRGLLTPRSTVEGGDEPVKFHC